MSAPKGYQRFFAYTAGSNVTGTWLLICDRCGAFVGGMETHNSWHAQLTNAAFIADHLNNRTTAPSTPTPVAGTSDAENEKENEG